MKLSKAVEPVYDVEYPRYCNRRDGWVCEYRVIVGKDIHGATEGFVKKKTFEEIREFYNKLKGYGSVKEVL